MDDVFDFEAFFSLHYQGLYQMLFQVTGIVSEAEDLAQEAFLRLHQNVEKIQGQKRKPWLYRVGLNLAYDILRQRQRARAWRRHEESSVTGHTHPVMPATVLERRDEVRRVLLSLSERQSHLLLLYSAGLSHGEIAASLSLQSSSISQLLDRAKRTFRQRYTSLVQRGELSAFDVAMKTPRSGTSSRGERDA